MNRRSFLKAVSRLATAALASPLVALVPGKVTHKIEDWVIKDFEIDVPEHGVNLFVHVEFKFKVNPEIYKPRPFVVMTQ